MRIRRQVPLVQSECVVDHDQSRVRANTLALEGFVCPAPVFRVRRQGRRKAREMDPVVRMFTSNSGTVRWVTTAVGTESLRFSVFGPDQWRNSSLFDDATALVRFQAEYERFLSENGFSESLVKDRRWRERRAAARTTGDRRQPLS